MFSHILIEGKCRFVISQRQQKNWNWRLQFSCFAWGKITLWRRCACSIFKGKELAFLSPVDPNTFSLLLVNGHGHFLVVLDQRTWRHNCGCHLHRGGSAIIYASYVVRKNPYLVFAKYLLLELSQWIYWAARQNGMLPNIDIQFETPLVVARHCTMIPLLTRMLL